MSSAQEDALELLQQRVERFLELYSSRKSENEQLKRQNMELEEKIQLSQEKLKDLEEKNNKLKISKALIASSKDEHDAKLKVNRLVREIDKCIALLNR